MSHWNFDNVPDQTGRTAIVTGSNTGIGFETARMLAQKGANVVLACRTREKGEGAVARIQADKPSGSPTFLPLDLGDLESVKRFAESFRESHERLDLLINNAGVMVPPYSHTPQGFELQFGTNHLGHFALAAQLAPLVLATPNARFVVVASTAASFGRIDFDDLDWRKRSYKAFPAYGQSKLANLLFLRELAHRLESAHTTVRATGAHPGWTATDLQRTAGFARFFNPYLAMQPVDGAMPTMRAATDPGAASGSYWGPSGMFELRGSPAPARVIAKAQDDHVAARLWRESEKLTGVAFEIPGAGEARAAS